MGSLELSQEMFALDPVEAWEVDFAHVGLLARRRIPCVAVVPTGGNQALNVCQRLHEHIAERAVVVSVANRFTHFVVVPGCGRSSLQSGGRGWLPGHPDACSPRGETQGRDLALTKSLFGVSRRGLWRFRFALLHIASLCWAEVRTKSLPWWGRGENSCQFSVRPTRFSVRGGRQKRRSWVPVVQELGAAAWLDFSWLIVTRRHRGAPRSHFSMLSPCFEAVVAASMPTAVVKAEERYSGRWRFSRRQELDLTKRSVVEGKSRRAVQQSTHQTSSVAVVAVVFHCHLFLTCREKSGEHH